MTTGAAGMSGDDVDVFGKPLRHLLRVAPPWAEKDRTVCGRAADTTSIISMNDLIALVKKHGQGRARFLVCQTCWSRHRVADRPVAWGENPAAVMADYAQRAQWSDSPSAARATAELRAIAELVASHRDEYDALVDGLLGIDDLREVRQRRATRPTA